MTNGDLASKGTGDLVQEFKETAKQAGTVFTGSTAPEKLRRTPERQRLVEKMRVISAELRARRAMADIRALLEDEDTDVRGWAAGQFLSIDPEWASATFDGLIYKMPAREVLDLKRRAVSPPPNKPALGELTTSALVQRFEDAALREYATRMVDRDDPTDMSLYNRRLSEVLDIMRELMRRDALGDLLPLLDSPNVTVRAEAARATLWVAPERASAVLEEIAAKADQWERVRAMDSLAAWKAGRTVVYGVS
ncbi:MAG: DUF2019 domain-containing protein [Deltaproteobacteria bacterium]|nr:DUF2019 domain-containing protein [Deltaproteobacteria bacterium]